MVVNQHFLAQSRLAEVRRNRLVPDVQRYCDR
jgi:hypothetical protein